MTFKASKLRVGVPRLDEEVSLELRARLHSAVKRAARPVTDHEAGRGTQGGEVPPQPGVAATSAGSTSEARGAQAGAALMRQVSKLRCDVDVRLRVRVPPPLSAVPGPLLAGTGGLLAKLVMQALLPSFLDLLAVDYGRWAAGDAKRTTAAAGSLLPPPTDRSQQAVLARQQQQPQPPPQQKQQKPQQQPQQQQQVDQVQQQRELQ